MLFRVYFHRYSPIIVCVIACIIRGSVLDPPSYTPPVTACSPGRILKRSSNSDAKDETEERRESCEVTVPRCCCRLDWDGRGVAFSLVGDLIDSEGVFGRRIAEAGMSGGPIIVAVPKSAGAFSACLDESPLLALAIFVR